MSMHLEHPGLSTTGRRTGKKKWPSAAAKRQAMANRAAWLALKDQYGIDDDEPKTRAKPKPLTVEPVTQGRRAARIQAASSDPKNWTTCCKQPDKIYTGTAMVGVATMHKSNMVPVFNDQAAKDISTMRRG